MKCERRLTRKEASTLVGQQPAVLEPSPIEPGTVIYDADTDEPIVAYMPLPDPGPLRRALLQIDCSVGVVRTYNYSSRSRTFGYAPRRPVIQREGCEMTQLGRDQPDVERVLESYADSLARLLTALVPDIVETNRGEVAAVLPEWRLGSEKLWTSGVVNDTAQLPYHRDGFNFPTWSAMPVLRRGTRGGHLHIPEYGVVLPCADGTVVLFQGNKWVHGVTPISRVKKGEGYRISVVYYALSGMKNCRTFAEETALAGRRRTEREHDMAIRLAAGDTTIPGRAHR